MRSRSGVLFAQFYDALLELLQSLVVVEGVELGAPYKVCDKWVTRVQGVERHLTFSEIAHVRDCLASKMVRHDLLFKTESQHPQGLSIARTRS